MDFQEIVVGTMQEKDTQSSFDCDDLEINDFFKKDALNWQNQKTTRVYVLFYKNNIIGFFTISCDSIKLKENENEKSKHPKMDNPLKEFPAIKIGRLGIGKQWQNQGLGSFVLKYALGLILEISNHDVACRFVTVDAYHQRVSWYLRHGFLVNEHYSGKREHISMRFDLLNIRNN